MSVHTDWLLMWRNGQKKDVVIEVTSCKQLFADDFRRILFQKHGAEQLEEFDALVKEVCDDNKDKEVEFALYELRRVLPPHHVIMILTTAQEKKVIEAFPELANVQKVLVQAKQ